MTSIRQNFMYNAVYQMLLIIIPLITTPYVSRVLGSEGVGAYTYTYTIANYFILAAMLGVKNYGNRSIASVRDNKSLLRRTFWEIYGLQFLCSLATLFIYFIYTLVIVQEYKVIALIQGLYVLSGLFDISWFFFGMEKFKITVTRNIVIRLLNLACIFIFVKTREDLWKYTLVMTLGVVFSQGYLWIYLKQFVGWYCPELKNLKKHIIPEVILFIPIIAVSLYTMMDKIMLGAMSTMEQVGFYEGSYKILNIPLGIITALGTVMLPRMSNLVAKGKTQKSGQYIQNSMIFVMFLASGMMFGIAGIAEEFVPIFLGNEYAGCALLIRIMAPMIPFIAWANVLRTQYLIPHHRDKVYIVSVVAGAVVNLVVNFFLIPHMHAMGAVIGTVCAEGCVCISQTILVRKKLKISEYIRNTGMYYLFGVIMLLVILWIQQSIEHAVLALIVEIIVGGGIYSLMSGLYFLIIQKRKIIT